MDANQVVQESADLEKDWQSRNAKFRDWYKILLLEDTLKQKDMESFTSNDPKTFFNLSRHLLTPDIIPHEVRAAADTKQGPRTAESQFEAVNNFLELQWKRHDRLSRRRGMQSWLRNLVSFVLATGWYSVFAVATEDGTTAEVWNPAEVFPDFGDEELVRCVHKYTVSFRAAERKLAKKGWTFPGLLPKVPTTVYDFWYTEGENVRNVVVMANQVVKVDEVTPFTIIPILTSPVGGLPDKGSIMEGSDDWKENVGESILATNEDIYKQFNKQMSFLQQLLRDAAQFRVLEKSRSGNVIENVDDIFKRGAVFRMSPEETLEAFAGPPVPVDVRTMLFDIQGMMQRGSLPYALYGNVQQEIASYLMSQITAAAHQILKDYKDAVQAVLEDVDKLWITHMKERNLIIDNFQIPTNLPEEVEVDVGLTINVAGDLLQRASVGRMLNPDFKLAETTTTKLLFPEIKDPTEEQAKVNAEMALKHPVALTVSTITGWRDEAVRLRQGGASQMADLLEKAADIMEKSLGQEGLQQPDGTTGLPKGNGATPPPGEIVPREYMGQMA